MTAATATPPLTSRLESQPEQLAYESRTPPTASPPRTPARDDTPSLVPFGEALRALVGLQPNWDSYGALPPSRRALEYAWWVTSMLVERSMPLPQVFPTPSGGVQLEWHLARASLEWEIDSEPPSGVFTFDDYASGERIDGELQADIDLLVTPLARILRG